MAGIHFTFDNFKELLSLNMGISQRLDENRAESFTLLYCSFEGIAQDIVDTCLSEILRTSDAIVNDGSDYFFILPYTDKYGAEIVKKMFDDFFAQHLGAFLLAYPADGEDAVTLMSNMQDSTSTFLKNDLHCLDKFTRSY
ncbi:MAG: hypothetical protein Q9M40_10825 [Sulfurimonas sp.]|nr:hypothetical protein [Sulfurimonas sp.]